MPEKQFQIHNTTRDPKTRLVRSSSPITSKMTLLLGGGSIRCMRNRPATVTESALRRMLPELVEKASFGLIRVTTLKGEQVDLGTLKALEKAPPAPPKPKPPVDSAANDKPAGIPMAKYADPKGIPQGAEVPMPLVGEPAIPEGEPAPEEPVLAEPPREEPVVQPKEGVPTLVEEAEEPEEPSSPTASKKSRRRRK